MWIGGYNPTKFDVASAKISSPPDYIQWNDIEQHDLASHVEKVLVSAILMASAQVLLLKTWGIKGRQSKISSGQASKYRNGSG